MSSGRNVQISPNAQVEKSVLWDNVRVEGEAEIYRAILADNVSIRSGELIRDSVVVPKSLVEGKVPPAKALSGRFQGENFVVFLGE